MPVSVSVPLLALTKDTAPSMALPASPNVRAVLLLTVSVAGAALMIRCVPVVSPVPE